MDMPANLKVARNAFTLVEMLVVIVIIGILVGLTAATLGPARVAARNGAINAEIKQLDMDLQNYKNEFGELPPTFIDINIVEETGDDSAFQGRQDDARNAVIRHLRKAFPRYVPGRPRGNPPANPDTLPCVADGTGDVYDEFANDVYYAYKHPITGVPSIDPRLFDPASALVFWLGGLPEQVPAVGGQWIPAGFHSDPQMPFKTGAPRKQPLFEFKADRVEREQALVSCYPWHASSLPAVHHLRYYPKSVKAPYVYFRARRRGANWQYCVEWDATPPPAGPIPVPYAYYHIVMDGEPDNICVAYRDPQDPPYWRNYDTYQIIAAGLDGHFGNVAPLDSAGLARNRVTKTKGGYFSDYDSDNLANFCEAATLEDEIE